MYWFTSLQGVTSWWLQPPIWKKHSQGWIIPRLVFDYLQTTLLVDHFDHLHPRKLTAGYPKWWFGKGGSFQIWPFLVSMLNFWGVILTIFSHLTISDASSCVIIRGHPTTSTSMARCWGWNCHQSRPFLEPGFFQSASKVAFFKGQGRVYPGPSVPMVFN